MPRPRLNPTEEQRKWVKSLAAYGVRQSDIARMINIRSPKTLRKYFRQELDREIWKATPKCSRRASRWPPMASTGTRPKLG
jgi:hypothetical protein